MATSRTWSARQLFASWFRSRERRQTAGHRRRGRTQLSVEILETRLTPASYAVNAQLMVSRLDHVGDGPGGAHAVVFFESSVADFQVLQQGLSAGTDAVVLDAGGNGLREMAAFLDGRQGLTAIHVVAHGAAGEVSLGSLTLDEASLASYGRELKVLGQALAPQGDLQLWSCNVGAGQEGQAFERDLAAAIGAPVAASDHAVGATALGGDWRLDVRTAGAQAAAPFDANALRAFDEVLASWSAAPSMVTGRQLHTATLVGGKVLVAGGEDINFNALATAELYDPVLNRWSSAGSMASPRFNHTATLLGSGKVLIAGGQGNGGVYFSAELYDPGLNTWSSAGSMATARYGHTATLLGNGKVLVTGGTYINGTVLSSAELYDPGLNTWSSAGSMATTRTGHTATLLNDGSGRVLVTGGQDNNGNVLSSAELYDPSSNTWSPTGAMAAARMFQTATLLGNGKVLVAGGENVPNNNFSSLSSAELYDPATKKWSAAASMAAPRVLHTATLLPTGKVLVAGRYDDQNFRYASNSAEVYDPAANRWSSTPSMAQKRADHAATLLGNGNVLVTGGTDVVTGTVFASAELYTPDPPAPTVTNPTAAGITANSATLGGNVTGTGITKRGVLFAPTSANATLTLPAGTGVAEVDATGTTGGFTVNAPHLSPATSYSYVAFASNSGGTTYTSPVSTFTTLSALGAGALLEGQAAGGDADVVAASGAWTAASNDSWLHTSASGTGNGTAPFTFDANPGAARTGTLTIAGLTLSVTQAGGGSASANPIVALAGGSPNSVAVDGAGNVYIPNGSIIKEWHAATQQLTTLITGLVGQYTVAADGPGNLYIADSSNVTLYEVPAGSQQLTTLATLASRPGAVALDAAGNVYFADTSNAINEWHAATKQVTVLVSSGLNGPEGVAVDAAGNVYIADTFNGAIKELPAGSQQLTTLVPGLGSPDGVAVDGAGNVYFTDGFPGAIPVKEWHASNQHVTTLVSPGVTDPVALAMDVAGNLYIPDANANLIYERVNAYVPGGPLGESAPAGSDALAVLPTTQALTGLFAPTTDQQSWLTLGTPANGVVPFSFTANTGTTARTAHITLLGRQITVTQAAKRLLTVTATSVHRAYGAADAFTYTISGFANGDTEAALRASGDLSGTVGFSSTDKATSPAGSTWTVTPDVSGLTATNYYFAAASGTLTIDTAHLTVTANDVHRAYGAADAFTYTITGFANGETEAALRASGDLAGTVGLSSTDKPTSPAGSTWTITADASGLTATNYDFVTAIGTLTIDRAHLTVTADNVHRAYRAPDAFTYTISGFANGETEAGLRTSGDLAGAVGLSSTDTSASPAGTTFTITPDVSGLTATNYDFTAAAGTLTIDRAHLIVTANDVHRAYGAADAFTYTVSGFANGETEAGLRSSGDLGGTVGLSSTDKAASPAGSTWAITPDVSGLTATNYDFAAAAGTLTIDTAHLTVTANDVHRAYGAADGFTYTMTGFANGETEAALRASGDLAGTLGLSSTDKPASPAGSTWTITPDVSGLTATNYDFTAAAGTLTIDTAHLTVKASDVHRAYGAADTFGYTITGFANSETEAGLRTSGALSGTVGLSSTDKPTSPAGSTWTITPDVSGLTATNYDFTAAAGTLTIDRAHLTVAATSVHRAYGVPDSFSYTISGFANSETEAGVRASGDLSGTVGLSSTDKATSPAGSTWTITPDVSGLTATNYDFAAAAGTLTVDTAHLTVTATSMHRAYGAADGFTYTMTGFANGETEAGLRTSGALSGTVGFSSADKPTSAAGSTWTITPDVSGLTAANYDFTAAAGTLTIDTAHLTVKASDVHRAYGAADTFGYTITGFANSETEAGLRTSGALSGTVGLSSTDTPTSAAGSTWTITADISGLTATNYDFAAAAGTLTIDRAHLTVTANDVHRAYGAADSFGYTISGFANSETEAGLRASGDLSGTVGLTSTDKPTSPAGSTWTITPDVSGLTATNYDFTAAAGTLTIDRAHLTVTADNVHRAYGAPDSFSYTITGFANGETEAGLRTSADLSGTVGFSSADKPTSPAGSTWTITPDVSGLTATNYDFAAAAGTLTVDRAHLTVTADNVHRAFGAPDAFTYTISGFTNGETEAALRTAGDLSGTVGFSSADKPTSPAGSTWTVTPNASGLTATNYDFATAAGTLTIDQAQTGTQLNLVGTAPGVYGQSAAFTAQVSNSSGTGVTPTGFAYFYVDRSYNPDGSLAAAGTYLGGKALDGTGAAAFSTTHLPVGTHTVTAVFNTAGTGNFATSHSAALTLAAIAQAQTGTALTGPTGPLTYGQQAAFTARVSNTSATGVTPAGTAFFYADRTYNADGSLAAAGTLLGSKGLDGSGAAAFSTTRLSAGTHTVTAVFNTAGTGNFATSHSAASTLTIAQAQTGTQVNLVGTAPSVYGQQAAFTAQVSNTSATGVTPAGTAFFYADRTYNADGSLAAAGTLLGSKGLDGSGAAAFSTTRLPAGTHTVTAVFNTAGTGNFATSHSDALALPTISQAQTGTLVNLVGTAPSVYGQQAAFTARVSNTSATGVTPAGTAFFYADRTYNADGSLAAAGTLLGSKGLDGSGAAAFSTTRLSAGTHTVTAVFNTAGTGNFATSHSAALTLAAIAQAQTGTALTGPTGPLTYGQQAAFTARVSNTSATGVTPAGTAFFYADRTYNADGSLAAAGTLLGSKSLDGTGAATFSTTRLPRGTHTVTAVFNTAGTGNFATSHSDALTETVV